MCLFCGIDHFTLNDLIKRGVKNGKRGVSFRSAHIKQNTYLNSYFGDQNKHEKVPSSPKMCIFDTILIITMIIDYDMILKTTFDDMLFHYVR